MSTFVARSLIHLSLSRSYSFSVVSTPPRLLGYGPRIRQLASLKHVVVQRTRPLLHAAYTWTPRPCLRLSGWDTDIAPS